MDRMCHVSLWAGICLPGKLSDVTLNVCDTKKVSGYTRHE